MFLHSFLADKTVKQFFYNYLISEKNYRFFFVSYATIFLLPIVYLYAKGDKTEFYYPNLISLIIGWGLIVLSVYAFFVSFKNYNIHEFLGLDRLKSADKVFYPLKVEGLNRYVRHPLYSFSYILIIGIFLISPNDYVLAASIITAIYLPVGIYFEEKKLLEEYGDAYYEYMSKVPKLIPSFIRI